jgi:hypothetical protein
MKLIVTKVYSCECPAWRNLSAPIAYRTCKHLREYLGSLLFNISYARVTKLGEEFENQRVGPNCGKAAVKMNKANKKVSMLER